MQKGGNPYKRVLGMEKANENKYGKEIQTCQTKNYTITKYLISMYTFKKLETKNWSKNRKPDKQRVGEIMEAFEKNKFLQDALHFAKIGKNPILHCYDGNHRREAINKIDFANEEMRKIKLIITILKTRDEEYIIERFREIGKSEPVPEPYYKDEPEHMECYENIKKGFEYMFSKKKFLKHHKKTTNPQRPNIKISVAQERFYYKIVQMGSNYLYIDGDKLYKEFKRLNKYLCQKCQNDKKFKQFSPSMLNKCVESGFYLCLLNKDPWEMSEFNWANILKTPK